MEEIKKKVAKIIDEDINPSLASHNGFVELVSVEERDGNTTVILTFMGGCAGCPGATSSTLKSIENYLNEELSPPDIVVLNSEHA